MTDEQKLVQIEEHLFDLSKIKIKSVPLMKCQLYWWRKRNNLINKINNNL